MCWYFTSNWLSCFVSQPVRRLSLSALQRISLWSSPASLNRNMVTWWVSICITAAPRDRPPCSLWLRAPQSGWTLSLGLVCSSTADWSRRGSTWASLTYSWVTLGFTCGSWATDRRTAQIRSSSGHRSTSCWLKGKVCCLDTSQFSSHSVLQLKLYKWCASGTGRSCWCSHGYIPLLLTISAAAGFLLLTMCLLALEKYVSIYLFKFRCGFINVSYLPSIPLNNNY